MGFKRFDPEDLVISTDSVTATVWSNNVPSLTTFFTSTSQTLSNTGQFYYHVYQTASSDSTAAVQFDIAYCDSVGSGSEFYNNLVTGSSPTRTNYGQYRTLVLGDENANFIFGNETGSYFYALSIERARYKEKLLPGTMTLALSGSQTLYLTDDSSIQSSVTFTDAGRVYNIVSGSAGTVYTGAGVTSEGWSPGSGSYGWFLPDIGTILLNGKALDGAISDGGIALGTGRNQDTQDNNPAKLFTAIEGAGSEGNGFLLNSGETLSSDFIFVRARNSEFNYSENPSFISGSTGAVIFDSFIDDPTTYITSVGLYNDNNELLAVAKLSRPLPKDFTKELLVRVKLDF
jgi:hypothetical protein